MQKEGPKESIRRFADIIDKNKMIEQLKKSGKIEVVLTFHHPNKTRAIKKWWCDSKQTIMHLEQLIRKAFAIQENESLFFYIDLKMPDKTKSLRQILVKRIGRENIEMEAATSQVF